MKKLIYLATCGLFLILLVWGCKKEEEKKLPVLTTTEISNITQNSISSGGIISDNGNADIVNRGVCWSEFENPTVNGQKTSDGAGSGIFTSTITGLTVGKKYYCRAYATNSVGTAYGNQIEFVTNAELPVLSTLQVSLIIRQNSASCACKLISVGDTSYSASGICWSTNETPTINDSKTVVTFLGDSYASQLKGLLPNTTYYVRAYATNRAGTGYGNTISFTTEPLIFDADGNIYHSITIGTQIWMVENLKTTRYRNGEPISKVSVTPNWDAYYDYNNDENNSAIYGRLYNWFAVVNSRNICPLGWHVPTDAEWDKLLSITKNKLQETGVLHWQSNNTDATNETGFTALPGGSANQNGNFSNIGRGAFWWTSSYDSVHGDPWYIYMTDNFSKFIYNPLVAFSVRCIKD